MNHPAFALPLNLCFENSQFVVVSTDDERNVQYEVIRLRDNTSTYLHGAPARLLFEQTKVWQTNVPPEEEVVAFLEQLTTLNAQPMVVQ